MDGMLFEVRKDARQRRGFRSSVRAGLVVGAIGCAAATCDAHITQLQVVRLESPTFGGMTFGGVGAYEKITARAYGELDPTLPGNALITDIQFAPRTAQGMVQYSMDVVIVKPIDPSKGSGKVFYDVVNRGSNLSWATFNQAPAPSKIANTDATGAGTGLLMRRGYTIVWSGWEDPRIIGTNASLLSAALPTAANPDGTSIVGKMIVEQIFDTSPGTDFTLPFAAATLDQTQAYMLVHNHTQFVGGPLVNRVTVPTSVWSYVNNTTVRINRADPFLAPYDAGAAFEFVFPAKDPIVEGIGFAATRDLISFLKHDASTQNPVANAIQYALGRGDSESGRYLKGFLYWGFNADEGGQIVFDGMNPHISGAHAIAANDRFGDANATGRSYQRHLSAKMEFPFTYGVRANPFTGAVDGIMKRCLASNTCPKIIHTDSGNEPYLKPVSLVTTDGPGNGVTPTDITLPDNVRAFTIGSSQHGPAGSVTTTPSGVCQQPGNPNQWAPYVRDLGILLDDWTTQGIAPPDSRHARVSDGTLVHPSSVPGQNFPVIPGVTYTGWYNPVDELDKSVLPNMPIPGESYTILVPKTDADGNDLPGVRTLDVQVPLATYTGWGLRRAPFAANEDCALTGQYIPFKATQAQRGADPRLSIAERYPTFDAYDAQLISAINSTINQRLLLCEDGNSELARLRQNGATRGVPNPPASFTPYSFALANASIAPSQPSLWPPNGKMVSETFTVTTPETCNVSCNIAQISSNDGASSSDWQITGPLTAQLRAQRSGGGSGRVYSVALQCSDPTTNLSTMKTVAVTVPHDQGK
jgi:hypothetical protein